jgi:uncharacterized protein (TIGR02145 family)
MKNLILILIFSFIFVKCVVENNNINVEGCEKLFTIQIIKIVPDSAYIGDFVTIIGKGFGQNQDNSVIYFNGTKATIYTSWNDTIIKLKVPNGAKSGMVWVKTNDDKSNEVYFKIIINVDPKRCAIKWMSKNLDVDHYLNGDSIPEVRDNNKWLNLKTGAWCYFNNNPEFGAIFGKLYNWYAVNDPRGLAPKGWHVATDEDWKELEMCLGMSQEEADKIDRRGTDEGGKLKISGTSHWLSPNKGATNSSGFSGLPGGTRRYYDGEFFLDGSNGVWWSVTQKNDSLAWDRALISEDDGIFRHSAPKGYGYSVRCVKHRFSR